MVRRRIVALLPAWLSGCALATPFRTPPGAEGALGDQAIAVVTHAVLVDDPGLRRLFWRHTEAVDAALPAQPGYLGHSKRTTLGGGEAWTLTVWSDRRTLEAFVETTVHVTAINEAMKALVRARFARFPVAADEVPPSWRRALAALEERGRTYS
jgi:hypothetical protein